MRAIVFALTLAAALAQGAAAQESTGGDITGQGGATAPAPSAEPAPATPPALAPQVIAQVLTLDQERLFADSAWGRRALADIERASVELAAENRQIEGDLTAEEKSLTERRATMTPEAFRAEADAFDARVQAIRKEQDGKALRLNRIRDVERQNFFAAAIPIMGRMMQDRGAVAILDARAIFLSVNGIDITTEMIRQIDATIGAGEAPPPEATAPEDEGEGESGGESGGAAPAPEAAPVSP